MIGGNRINRINLFNHKQVIILFLMMSVSGIAFGQKSCDRTEFDTLKIYKRSIHVEYYIYRDGALTEQVQALLYPIVHHVKKKRFLRKSIMEDIYMDSIVFHGDKKSYLENREYKIETFFHGYLKEVKYFDDQGIVLSKEVISDYDDINSLRRTQASALFFFTEVKRPSKNQK